MNVLVIDDQPEVVRGLLSGVNWQRAWVEKAFPAYSLKEAQNVFLQERVDMLLCDVELPPHNGFELLRWARQRKPEVGCIFLTAHAEFGYAQEAVKLGSFDYILQPAPYEEIEEALIRAAGKLQESAKLRRYYAYEEYRSSQAAASQPPEESLGPVRKAMEYIRRNLDKELNRTQIAEMVYLSPEHLSRLFKRETGGSLSEYILTEKMRVAQSLLADTDVPVSLVASRVGYCNFSYFSQVFKKFCGCSPVEYRARRHKPQEEMGKSE
ncbi:MAG: helix-turn-helix domain-containing protein [Acutalibacter sp.]|nr:helix-turn-helix domain-containing protein [Acutalibacter sp.]